jgi:hypothetical protein
MRLQTVEDVMAETNDCDTTICAQDLSLSLRPFKGVSGAILVSERVAENSYHLHALRLNSKYEKVCKSCTAAVNSITLLES